MNKEIFKRWSTWANGLSMVLAGMMTYFDDAFPEYHSEIMMVCAGIIAACQFIKQEAKND